MSLLLQIETATTLCSVALTHNGELLSVKELNERNRHAEVITLFIEEVIQSAGKSWTEIDAIAVSSGPGSYTGLRIGVSTAKGLCYATDKPLIAVETLQAMASGYSSEFSNDLQGEGILLCPMIDARRMEVYTALYTPQGECIQPTSAQIITSESFAEKFQDYQIVFFGDGAAKCREVLAHQTNAVFNIKFANSARHLTQLALAKFRQKQFENVAYFEPFYLKDFIVGAKH